MMPTIQISDETFARLKALAEPFVDTPETVIARLLDSTKSGFSEHGSTGGEMMVLDPDHPGSLSHTRVRAAFVGEQQVHQAHWNGIMRELHARALEHFGSFQSLKKASGANVRQGRYESEGFTYIVGADVSIQGVDSNLAWQHSLALAKQIQLPLTVEFTWYDKESAAHPRQTGKLSWSPS